MNSLRYYALCIVGLVVLIGCGSVLTTKEDSAGEDTGIAAAGGMSTALPSDANEPQQADTMKPASALLRFSLKLNQRVYEASDWGDPPQFAIWLENADSSKIRTVWVTYRTGTGNWVGKVECPVSLPYWVSRYNRETQTSGPPTPHKAVVDAVTGATPKHDFTVPAEVPAGSRWKYFIEVNVSGDFNINFPSVRANGAPDPQGNGQPSLIYQGQIEAVDVAYNIPKLIGRTEQWQSVDYIIEELEGITTAKNLFSKIEVSCRDHR